MKPIAKLTGEDGNIFSLIGIAVRAMKRAGVERDIIETMRARIYDSNSYDEVVTIIMEYVEVE